MFRGFCTSFFGGKTIPFNRLDGGEPLRHDVDGLGVVVDEGEAAAGEVAGLAGGATASKEVEYQIARMG